MIQTSHILEDASLPRVFGISGGRSSAFMLKEAIRYGLRETDIFSFQNTGKEKLETLDFIHEIELRWNVPILWLEYIGQDPGFVIVDYKSASRKGEPFERLLESKSNGNYLPNVMLRLCTYHLKIKTLQAYLSTIGIKNIMPLLGLGLMNQSELLRLTLVTYQVKITITTFCHLLYME